MDRVKKFFFVLRSLYFLTGFFILLTSTVGGAGSDLATKKVLVLGFDGMDPVLLRRYMGEGIMPNFKLLKERGDFMELVTSMPPQSPVAWSNLITGMDPGGHGIFDFIAREPTTYLPYLSTSKTLDAKRTVKLGDWLIPFSKAETLLLRKGKAFWEILEAEGIPSTVIKIPANFPPVKAKSRTLSGMGTPDILGSYGTFSFYTTKEIENEQEITSGKVLKVMFLNDTTKTELMGPINPFKTTQSRVKVELDIKRDPENPVALIRIGKKKVLLNEGEWSDWVNVKFKLAPFQTVTGICRLFLVSVRPDFELYVSPINIDPFSPTVDLSTPKSYASEVAKKVGLFYTQGMPEDTKALEHGYLHKDNFLELSGFIKEQRVKMLDLELRRFHSGLLFVYFSTTDPIQHMFWRNIDKHHPAYSSQEASKYSHVIRNTYKDMDRILGKAMNHIKDKTTIMVLSDHGFGSFRRYFNMNTWLKRNGYLNFIHEYKGESGEFFENVDFNRTKAYALGFNGIYINTKGREGAGIVLEGNEREMLLDEIIRKLEVERDPTNGNLVIKKAYKKEDIYSGKYRKDAPDLVIGYNRGYRASWETALGKVPNELLGDNMKEWSGTHLWDKSLVPGIILSNRKIRKEEPALYDIAPTILAEFGIKKEKEMVGNSIF